jgi:hypothetical protein
VSLFDQVIGFAIRQKVSVGPLEFIELPPYSVISTACFCGVE